MLTGEDFVAAVDFVRKNEDGLQVIQSREDAFGIVLVLSDRMRPAKLVARMRHSRFCNYLLERYLNTYSGGGIHEEVGRQVWKLRFDPTFRDRMVPGGIKRIFLRLDVYRHLLVTVPIDELSVFVETAPDDYLNLRVRHFLEHRDYERAWEEVLNATREVKSPISGLRVETFARMSRWIAEAVGRDKLDKSLQKIPPQARYPQRGSRAEWLCKRIQDRDLILLHNYFNAKKKARRRRKKKV